MRTNRYGYLAALAIVVSLAGCGTAATGNPSPSGSSDVSGRANVAGKHVHKLDVAGLSREVIVYVPVKAAGAQSVPAVLMFHGTSGDGEKFYDISGWKEKADAEGLIAVFPSALTYCLKEDDNGDGDFTDAGERKVTTKWTSGELGTATMPQCSQAELAQLSRANFARADHPVADDIAFVKSIMDLLVTGYAVDRKRIYASGFSNGAGMTARLTLELSDRFAAIANAAGGLTLEAKPAAWPISVVHSVGSVDDRIAQVLGQSKIPISPTLFTDMPKLQTHIDKFLVMLQLAKAYSFDELTISGTRVGRYTFSTSTAGASNSLIVFVIDGLGHQYPNGTNHPIAMADELWKFFSVRTLP